MKILTFDLEISKSLPQGCTDWWEYAPLGISCAATLAREDGRDDGVRNGPNSRVWTGAPLEYGGYPSAMTPPEVCTFIRYLAMMAERGYTIASWNGLSFDWQLLARECGDRELAVLCADLARAHVDVAFQMVCERGFMIGLDAAAKGLGLGGKPEGMSGALAPELWAQGWEAQEQVLEYVRGDARTLADVHDRLLRARALWWTTKAGKRAARPWVPCLKGDERFLTVEEALQIPEPEGNDWFQPWDRQRFCAWLPQAATFAVRSDR